MEELKGLISKVMGRWGCRLQVTGVEGFRFPGCDLLWRIVLECDFLGLDALVSLCCRRGRCDGSWCWLSQFCGRSWMTWKRRYLSLQGRRRNWLFGRGRLRLCRGRLRWGRRRLRRDLSTLSWPVFVLASALRLSCRGVLIPGVLPWAIGLGAAVPCWAGDQLKVSQNGIHRVHDGAGYLEMSRMRCSVTEVTRKVWFVAEVSGKP